MEPLDKTIGLIARTDSQNAIYKTILEYILHVYFYLNLSNISNILVPTTISARLHTSYELIIVIEANHS